MTFNQQIKNLATDIVKFVADGCKLSPSDEYKRRLEICNKCEYLKNGRCEICSCFMGIKARMMSAECPKQFW